MSKHHCQADMSTIILTGGTSEGMNAESEVFEYSGLGGENVTFSISKCKEAKTKSHIPNPGTSSHHEQDSGLAIRELPSLIHPRFGHACGLYTMEESQVYHHCELCQA